MFFVTLFFQDEQKHVCLVCLLIVLMLKTIQKFCDCKSLWIKVSAKLINVNVNVQFGLVNVNVNLL